MLHTDTDRKDEVRSYPLITDDPFTVGDEMLERAKKVAQDIDDRIRKLTEKARQITDDTATNTSALGKPADQDSTDEQPSLPRS